MRTNFAGVGDSRVGSAVSHRHWGCFSSLSVHLIHQNVSGAWPGFETCFKEQEGKKQISFL